MLVNILHFSKNKMNKYCRKAQKLSTIISITYFRLFCKFFAEFKFDINFSTQNVSE